MAWCLTLYKLYLAQTYGLVPHIIKLYLAQIYGLVPHIIQGLSGTDI